VSPQSVHAPRVKAGEIVELTVDSLTLDGEGVGKLAEREVHCRGAFPSEVAKVRIEAVSRHHPRAHARLVQLTQKHAARRVAPCPNHESRDGHCTGCTLMELSEEAQRDAKRTMLRERFGLEVERVEPAADSLGYRYSSKRVAFGRRGFVYLGSYAHGSHAPAVMRGCLVDHPRLVRAFALIENAVCELGIAPYDEKSGQGDLRYVWAKTNGHDVIVTLITAAAESRVAELVPRLQGELAGILHSVQPSRGNAMRGNTSELLHGQAEVTISLLSQRVEVGALGFVQPNPAVAEQAYRALISPVAASALGEPTGAADVGTVDAAQRGELAFDLYAGTGVTTRVLGKRFAEVFACEAHPESAAALGIEPESVESFLTRAVAHRAAQVPQLVIANPPRKGLGVAVCGLLTELAAPQVSIMSCGPEALASDLARLAPRYELVSLQAFDTLPQTAHVELVAQLRLRTPH
jgi:23S rRNA (uracil1939-C5)-methyltransferase